MRENGSSANGNAVKRNDAAGAREDTRLVLDDELNAAATPFLYLLSSLVIAVAVYLLYAFMHG